MSDADFGTDFSGVTDLTPSLAEVSGRQCLLEALLRRLSTPRGGLFYDESYGTDITAYANTATDPRVIEQAIESELLQDERVDDVRATVTLSAPALSDLNAGRTFAVEITFTAADLPYTFTVSVDALTGVQLLEGIGE